MGGTRQALRRSRAALATRVEDGPGSPREPSQPFPLPASAGVEVGAADDAHEHAADRAADTAVRRLAADGAASTDVGSLGTLRRRDAVGAEGGALDASTSQRITSARGGGSALPDPLRRRMESAFDGADFSGVRLHTGGAAADLNASVGAHAFTVGRDVFVGATTPSLDTREGQHTLAHELAHTLQPDQQAGAAPARRKLATGTFSAQTFSDQGLAGGFRVSGKSKFGRLADLLDEYQATTTRQEELRLLGLIVTACDGWTSSTFRTKNHSKSKKKEEGDKSTEVTRIRTAAIQERDDIMSTMDDSLAMALPLDQQADGLVRTLSRYLGSSVSDLLALSDEAFRDLYITRVYIENVKAKKGAKGADPAAKKLCDLIFGSKGKYPALTPGLVKDMIDKIAVSKIDDFTSLGQLAAPALAGDLSSTLTPRGMTAGSGITITGNQSMLDKTAEALDAISSTPIGRELFKQLATYGTAPDQATEKKGHQGAKATQVVARIWPSALATASDLNSSGELTYGIAAGNGGVGFDPNSDRVGSEAQADKEQWRKRDACVALFHELIHVLLAARKTAQDAERWDENGQVTGNGTGGSIAMSDQGDMAECRIVGVAYASKIVGDDGRERTVTLPFNDEKHNPMTENQFRLQLAKVKLDQDDAAPKQAFLRPGYAQVSGQVKLTPEESVVDLA